MTDFQDILARLPHRYPFLMVDKIVEVLPNENITAIKNVSANEQFFQGHYPGNPVMPGVMIVEALMQAGMLLASYSTSEPHADHVGFVLTMDRVRFRKPVKPGDSLILSVTMNKQASRIWSFTGYAYIEEDTLAAEATWTGMVDKLPKSKDE